MGIRQRILEHKKETMSSGAASKQQQDDEGVILPEEKEQPVGATLWDYLQTETGGAIAKQVLDIVHGLQRATIEATAEQNRRQSEITAQQQVQGKKNWQLWIWVQGLIFLTVMGAFVFLAWNDKMTATAASVVCTALGYLYGRAASK